MLWQSDNKVLVVQMWCIYNKITIRKKLNLNFLRIVLSDPFGARTQDPNIKSVVLYLLS